MRSPLLQGTHRRTPAEVSHSGVHVAEPHLLLLPSAPPSPPSAAGRAPGTGHSPGTAGRAHWLRRFTDPRFQLASSPLRSLHVGGVCKGSERPEISGVKATKYQNRR